jgi:acetylornithine deacetylase/succinyl-diaminopimelate desuccinylase-like protein
MNDNVTPIYDDPAGLLSKLIRYDTTNPPGNEKDCILFIKDLLVSSGIEVDMVSKDPKRPNLIARYKGNGTSPPLLLYGHADVVSAKNQQWSCPPFDGIVDQGYVWGRGALDMKGALAMMLCSLLKAKAGGIVPSGDIIFAVFSDEEEQSEFGARYVVDEYPGLFDGVLHAIGEVGGFTLHLNGRRYYPIMVAEKQKCSLVIRIKGTGGHGSIPVRKQAMAKLAYVLQRLDRCRLPVHIMPVTSQMLEILSKSFSFPVNLLMKGLANPLASELMLKIFGDRGKLFDPLLHNTANATVIKTGDKINVIPNEMEIHLDGRLLPGMKPVELIDELTKILGKEFIPEVTYYSPGPGEVDMELYPLLSQLIHESDEDAVEAIPIPFMISACTDGAHLSKLGIQTYGFTPLLLPPEIEFSSLLHGPDERVPIKALEWGADIYLELIKRYGTVK